ncbi:hypothetical protein G3I34_05320 [Streptomyces sp. SID8014]|nr:hypothetical protein [Streptomyces sp. SID8014]
MSASGGLVGGLEPLAEALGAARRCGAELWVRGGRAMGCTLGRVTRDHGDIDWFTWADGAHGLTGELLRLGCTEVPGPPAALRRGFATGGLESGFTPVDRDHLAPSVVAAGRWAGTPVAAGSARRRAGADRRAELPGGGAPRRDRDQADDPGVGHRAPGGRRTRRTSPCWSGTRCRSAAAGRGRRRSGSGRPRTPASARAPAGSSYTPLALPAPGVPGRPGRRPPASREGTGGRRSVPGGRRLSALRPPAGGPEVRPPAPWGR